jgi:hypothetical protein
MTDAELDPMVRLLVELEQPFDPDRHYDFAPDALVRFALTASDYWADKALDWLTFGCPIRPVEAELRHVASDRDRPQALRHRTLRLLKHNR